MMHSQASAPVMVLLSIVFALFATLYAGKADGSASDGAPRDPKPLVDAVASGDIAKVKALLAKGYDAKTAADDRGTVLIVAVDRGYKDIAALLMDAGSEVDAPKFITDESDGQVPSELDAIEMDLTGSDILAGSTQMTPLEMAALRGNIEIAQLLVDRGAKVNVRTFGGMTALHYAAWNGHADLAALLIAKGANVGAAANEELDDLTGGVEPIHCAVDSTEVVTLLLDSSAAVDARDEFDQTPLMLAAERGNADVVALLLARGADAKARYGEHGFPLLSALRGASLCRPGLLADTGDPEYVKCVARFRQYEAVARMLVEKGADPEATGHSGETPLHAAASAGSTEIISLLISKGVNVNAKDAENETPLDMAVTRRNADAADLLRRHGGVAGAGQLDFVHDSAPAAGLESTKE